MLPSPLTTWRNILFFPLGCGELGYDNVPRTCAHVRLRNGLLRYILDTCPNP